MAITQDTLQDAKKITEGKRKETDLAEQNEDLLEEARQAEVEIEEATNRMEAKAFFEELPIRDDSEVAKIYAHSFKVNLTDAKKSLVTYPNQYEIQGHDIPSVVKQMRRHRRTLKGDYRIKMSASIDNIIKAYSDYLDKCIDSIYWINKYKIPLKKIGFNEGQLRKINSIKDEDTRRQAVDCLCKFWELDLERKKCEYNEDYSKLSKEMTLIKRKFKSIVKKSKPIYSPKEEIKKQIVKMVCNNPGISSRQLHDNLDYNLYRKSSPQIIAKMAKDQNITNVNGAYYKFNDEIKKNVHSYTAAFIDSDGYITMDKNNNPRVGLVATGDRGRAFMIEMQKSLGLGRLHLDQKSPQNTRLVNRLNFYSQDDIFSLLTKCRPHFRMKGNNADVLLELIRMKKSHKKEDWYKSRSDELFKLMKYYNHSDNIRFDWFKYNIDIDNISKLIDNSKMDIMDDIEKIGININKKV